MFKLISASRQVFRASLREREKGRGLASSQPAPPHFLFRCLLDDEPQHGSRVTVAHHQQGGVTAGHPQQHSHLLPLQCLETKEGWWWDQHSKSGGRSAPVGRSLLEVLYLGGVVSLALHLFHDRCCNCCPSNVLIRKLAIFEISQCPPFAVSLTNAFM